jgi:hypothetical protein
MRTWFFVVAISLAAFTPWSSTSARESSAAERTEERLGPPPAPIVAYHPGQKAPEAQACETGHPPFPVRPAERYDRDDRRPPILGRPADRYDRDDRRPPFPGRPSAGDHCDDRRPPHQDQVIIRDGNRKHTDPAVLLAGLLITGCILANASRPAAPPPAPDPITYAKQRGTYYSCRAESLANFKANFIGVYTNDFASAPAVRPAYIPKECVSDGQTVFIVYCQRYRSYGFWDPNCPERWIPYSVWTDASMVDQLMLRNYYLYPTR